MEGEEGFAFIFLSIYPCSFQWSSISGTYLQPPQLFSHSQNQLLLLIEAQAAVGGIPSSEAAALLP